MSKSWLTLNGAPNPKSDPTKESFTITAPPKTDIWRRSDDDDVFNAPILYQSMLASDFKKVEVTVYAPWATQYDQAGLIIAFPTSETPKPTQDRDANEAVSTKGFKWIKAGIEFFQLSAVLGMVGTDRYSDWSLSPMSQEYHQKARFRAEKVGTTLWIYAAQEGEEKMKPMREVKWAFMEGREEKEVWVGVYAAKPTPEDGEDDERGIEVSFEDLVVEREGEEE